MYCAGKIDFFKINPHINRRGEKDIAFFSANFAPLEKLCL